MRMGRGGLMGLTLNCRDRKGICSSLMATLHTHRWLGEQSAFTDLFLTMKEHFLSVPDLLGHWAEKRSICGWYVLIRELQVLLIP